MWYTDVSEEEWVLRSATSTHGRSWKFAAEPVLKAKAEWESSRLFYPTVLKVDDVYLMWYGSYWSARPHTTAIGLAASLDSQRWFRNSHNPVLKPDHNRPWDTPLDKPIGHAHARRLISHLVRQPQETAVHEQRLCDQYGDLEGPQGDEGRIE